MIFFLLTSLEIFIQIFVQKMADFTILESVKKIEQNGEKAVGRARKTGFFSWPKGLFLSVEFEACTRLF